MCYKFVFFKKKTLTGLFLFFTCFVLNAQISGTALNKLKEPVAFATVILKTAQDSSIVAFTQTDKLGFYKIKQSKLAHIYLLFLLFLTQRKPFL